MKLLYIGTLALLVATAACPAGETVLTVPDAAIKPGQTAKFELDLAPAAVKDAPALKFAAYIVYPDGEAGMAAVLKLAVNDTAVTDKFPPAGKPKAFVMPNHQSAPKDWPLWDATAVAWTLLYDRDVLPPIKGSRYYSPQIDNYLYAFPVGPLWKPGRNAVAVTNLSDKYPVRIVSMTTHDDEFKRAAERFKEVPADRVLPAVRAFPPVKPAEAKQRFELCHKLMEGLYNSDGSWAKGYSDWSVLKRPECKHPLVRWTGEPVLAYLTAARAEPNELYLKRAKEGLAWLLAEQTESGAYRWYWTAEGSVDANSLYDTAIAGRALVAGFEQFKDKRYLDASARAAKWAMAQPVSGNANYDLFAVWHLAAHYRATKDEKVLASAVDKAVATLKDQLPNGMWSDDHNQQICYHSICARGLVELLSVLPKEHPQYETVRAGTFRAINHIIAEQGADGGLRKHPNGGDWTGYAPGPAYAAVPLIDARRRFGWKLDEAINGLVAAPMDIDPSKRATWDANLNVLLWWHAAAWDWAVNGAEAADKSNLK